MGSVTAYGVGGGHRHTPEIVQNLATVSPEPVRVSFTPVLAPMPRGILAVASAPLADDAVTEDQAREVYAKAYAAEPFVHLLPAGVQPATKSRGRLEHRADRRSPSTPTPGASSSSPHRQPHQGHRRRRVPVA